MRASETHGTNRQNGRSVDELTEQNIHTVSRIEEAAKEQRTSADRIAEAIANFCGINQLINGLPLFIK